jgi:predicted MPP superfamily phosphohydrolase
MLTIHTVHRRVITIVLIAASSYWIVPGWKEVGFPYFLLWLATFMMLFGSQVFWIVRVIIISERFIPRRVRRIWLWIAAAVLYVFFFLAYNSAPLKMIFTGHELHASDPSFYRKIIDGIFSVWLVGSFLGFVLVMFFWAVDRTVRVIVWGFLRVRQGMRRSAAPESGSLTPHATARRRLLQQMAIVASATPFAAAIYGLSYERLAVEVTHRRIALSRLPKAFDGFRIAQLSDFHISSFMPAGEIGRCVAMTNQLKPDLVVLTGDYLSWDPSEEGEVVKVLADLQAPFGVFGCLGNHEIITQTEASITELFAVHNIRILRQAHAPIQSQGETINLIGIDDSHEGLDRIEQLMIPDSVNILLIHDTYYDTFGRAAEAGIDLTLVGHTHGGQLSLGFLHPALNLARLETRYTRGWYERSGSQLYVNRGIGTTIIPIRVGARPEITLLELVREV